MAAASVARAASGLGGRLHPSTAAVFVCDIQDKFRNHIFGMPAVIDTTSKVVRGANALKVPVFVTEQYPQRLGQTVPELAPHLGLEARPAIAKTKFSMWTPELERAVAEHDGRTKEQDPHSPGVQQVLLCGIEAHVCILQTASDLLARGYEVHVVVDGVSSQRPVERAVALQRLAQMGAYLCTSEMAVFQMCGDSKHPNFREISAIAKEARPDPLPFNGVAVGTNNL